VSFLRLKGAFFSGFRVSNPASDNFRFLVGGTREPGGWDGMKVLTFPNVLRVAAMGWGRTNVL